MEPEKNNESQYVCMLGCSAFEVNANISNMLTITMLPLWCLPGFCLFLGY